MLLWLMGEEVYIGYSLMELAKVRECLALNHIKYDYKVVSSSGNSRGRSGSFGLNSNYEKQYYVYVKRKDSERAKYLVDRALHG